MICQYDVSTVSLTPARSVLKCHPFPETLAEGQEPQQRYLLFACNLDDEQALIDTIKSR